MKRRGEYIRVFVWLHYLFASRSYKVCFIPRTIKRFLIRNVIRRLHYKQFGQFRLVKIYAKLKSTDFLVGKAKTKHMIV